MDFVHFCFIFAACFYSDTKGASGYLVYVDKPATWDEARSNCTFTYKGRLASFGDQDLQRNTLASCVPSATDVWTGKYFEIDPEAKDKMEKTPSIDLISAIQQCILKQKDIRLEEFEVNCDPATRLTSGKEIDLTPAGILKQDEGKDCYYTEKGTEYMGFMNKTEGDKDCKIWSVARPDIYSNVTHNYCRNPTNEAKPWCYNCTNRSKTADCRQRCKVNRCDVPWGVVTIRKEDSSTWTEEFEKYTNDKRRTYLCEMDYRSDEFEHLSCKLPTTEATYTQPMTSFDQTKATKSVDSGDSEDNIGKLPITETMYTQPTTSFDQTKPTQSEDSGDSGDNIGLIAGVAGAVGLIALILVVLLIKRCANTRNGNGVEKIEDGENISMQDMSHSQNISKDSRRNTSGHGKDNRQIPTTSGGLNIPIPVNNKRENLKGDNLIAESSLYQSVHEDHYALAGSNFRQSGDENNYAVANKPTEGHGEGIYSDSAEGEYDLLHNTHKRRTMPSTHRGAGGIEENAYGLITESDYDRVDRFSRSQVMAAAGDNLYDYSGSVKAKMNDGGEITYPPGSDEGDSHIYDRATLKALN